MQRANEYYRISEAARCCLNCRYYERHYTTDDEKEFFPAPAGCCVRERLRLKSVTEVCRHYAVRETEREAATPEEILEFLTRCAVKE